MTKKIDMEKEYEVTVVGNIGANSLVQYVIDGALHRTIIPTEKVIEGMVDAEELKMGVEYGLPFSDFLKFDKISADAVEKSLHSNGIWTFDDLTKNTNQVIAALQAVLRLQLSEIVKQSAAYLQQNKE